MNTKLQFLKNYIENNTKETINLINRVIKSNIESLTSLKEIENKFFEGILLSTNEKQIVVTICNKNNANDVAYKYWAYFCQENAGISLLDKIDMKAYSEEEHHDIMEMNNQEKNISIKIHYIFNNQLTKKELINQDELLVFIEKF